MHYVTLLVLFILHCSPAFGQEDKAGVENRLSVHLTKNSLLGSSGKSYDFNDVERGEYNTIRFESGIDFGLSYFRVKESGIFYRLGIIGLNISESRDSETIRTATFGLEGPQGGSQSFSRLSTQLELGKYFLRNRIRLGAGAFIRPTYFSLTSQPRSSLGFNNRISDLSVSIGLNPIVEFALQDNLSITAQLPFRFGEMAYEVIQYDNPFFIERDRRISEFTTKLDLAMAAQLGLTVDF